jgi:alkylation response protein AidB-like acyl-CoA dehydrogenase
MKLLQQNRRNRRESDLYQKAVRRSAFMTEPELVAAIDLTLMHGAGAIQRYHNLTDHQLRQDTLADLRIGLEASLAMLDRLLD